MDLNDSDDTMLRRLPIRRCTEQDMPEMLQIINASAVAYRGVIPADRWHEPYMSIEELQAEFKARVRFTGYVLADALVGVMGVQEVHNVRLIRHAYILPEQQGHGVGSKLLEQLHGQDGRPLLIGTWAAASWAIRFYERHGFGLVPHKTVAPLLRAYWNVPERQVETSVVLSSPILSHGCASKLIAAI